MGKATKRLTDHRRMSKEELSERLAALQMASTVSESEGVAREKELQTVLHELEVYQIELEMQVRELRESREALEDSHNRYVNLYDFAPVGYMTLSDQGVIKEINLTAAGMLGVERQWLLERSLAPWIVGADLSLFRAHLKQCRQDGGKVKTPLHLTNRNKRSIPVELSTTCHTEVTSGLTVFRTAIVDLTERKKAEAELDRFFNLSNDLICIVGSNAHFLRVNPACEEALGYSAAELRARPLFDFMHPDDRDASLAEFIRLRKDGASTASFQNRYIRKDRSIVWLSWNTITSENNFYCVGRDVTDQVHAKVRAENQYNWLKEMVHQIPLPLFLVETKSGAVVSMSATADVILKEFPKSALDTFQPAAFFANDEGQKLPLESWPRMRAVNGEELSNEPFIWQTPQGAIHLLVSSRNIPNEYDHPAMAVIVAQDVTHLKELEESLHETVGVLEQERDLRERFVFTLTHDLRTPLTSAKMSAGLLMRRPGDSIAVLKNSNQILKSINRVDYMIQDLLDANRIRAGEKLPLTITDFDLTQLVKETLDELSTVHGNRFVLDAQAPVHGKWSKSGLRRVVENLAGNAIKYGATDKPITVSVAEDLGHQVIISVHNFGNPIPKNEQSTLFQQFRRAARADKGTQRGWGIGLTLVKGTVEAHGGKIKVESNLKKGTTFLVTLPYESHAA